MGLVIDVEGGIASGKTTISKALTKYLKSLGLPVIYYEEPIDRKFLKKYIDDMETYGFVFQIYMVGRRIQIRTEALKMKEMGYICIIDRGLIGDCVFAELQIRHQHMTLQQKETYYDIIQRQTPPDIILYLKSDPLKSYNRMRKRKAEGEIEGDGKKSGYSLVYFEELHSLHEEIIRAVVQESNVRLFKTGVIEEIFERNGIIDETILRNIWNSISLS
jgi:deoxyadenosine/deoxycytidine kinase